MENELRETDSISSKAEMPRSTSLVSSKALWSSLRRGPKSRIKFAESHLNKNLAFQIRAMRASRGWSQEELARRTGMNQNMIYRLENPSYGKPTISTLKRIAAAFDVALVVRFLPFSRLVDWVTGTPFVDRGLSSDSLAVPTFREEVQVSLGSIPSDINAAQQEPPKDLGSIPRDLGPESAGAAGEVSRPHAA
jgi:transcriptional regulator with XRE-family HTH domain